MAFIQFGCAGQIGNVGQAAGLPPPPYPISPQAQEFVESFVRLVHGAGSRDLPLRVQAGLMSIASRISQRQDRGITPPVSDAEVAWMWRAARIPLSPQAQAELRVARGAQSFGINPQAQAQREAELRATRGASSF